MAMKTLVLVFLAALALLVSGGCSPTSKEITSLQRKEAASLVSEAQFALQLKDFARAEGLLTKATGLCPDTGKYWVDLGSIRVRLKQKEAARVAYKSGFQAYEVAAKKDANDPGAVLQKIYVLALLGRIEEARAELTQALKRFPENRSVKSFSEGKQLDKMLADPRFKEIAL